MKHLIIGILFILGQFGLNEATISEEEDNESTEPTNDDDIKRKQSGAFKDHPYGHAIELMKFNQEEHIFIDLASLDAIFLNPEVSTRKIVAVSIIGAFRKGKSFFMDYALRFMYANYKSVSFMNNTLSNKQNWMGKPDEPLTGFTWRGGSSRDTTGVILWSDVFLHDYQDPKTRKIEKIAIILLDTQGLFDSSATPTENSRIFALGTLISSVQIFNLNDVIQENQLEYLQMATDFAKYAIKKNKNDLTFKPFQSLIFLMRDWQNKDEFEFGHVGGASYLASVLNIRPDQPEVLKDVRRFIEDSFEQRYCFLLPHPGPNVVNNKNYDGRLSEIDEDFKEHLKSFIEWLLKSTNLKKKKVLNNEVIGSDYNEYIKAYFKAFEAGEIPNARSLHSMTVDKHYDIIILELMVEFKELIKKPVDFKVGDDFKETIDIEQEMSDNYNIASKEIIQLFDDKKKLGTKKQESIFRTELEKQMKTYFEESKIKQLDSYFKLKNQYVDHKKKMAEVIELHQNETKEIEIKNEQEIQNVQQENQKKTQVLEMMIEEMKNKTTIEIQEMNIANNRSRSKAEKLNEDLRIQFDNERKNIQQLADNATRELKQLLEANNERISQNHTAAQHVIESQQSERLAILQLEADIRREDIAARLKIAEKREQALADERKLEMEQRVKENLIREEALKLEKEDRIRAEEERRKANQEFKEQMMILTKKTLDEEKLVKNEKDAQFTLLLEQIKSIESRIHNADKNRNDNREFQKSLIEYTKQAQESQRIASERQYALYSQQMGRLHHNSSSRIYVKPLYICILTLSMAFLHRYSKKIFM